MNNSELTRKLEACGKTRRDLLEEFSRQGVRCSAVQLSNATTFPHTSNEKFIQAHACTIVDKWLKDKEAEIINKINDKTKLPPNPYVLFGVDDARIVVVCDDRIIGYYDSRRESFESV